MTKYTPTPVLLRFISKIQADPITGCWEWIGWKDKDGYGFIASTNLGDPVRAHRWSYEFFIGKEIQYEIDHNCNNPGCVNPQHLTDLPHRQNILRSDAPPAKHARKKLCPRGHEWRVREVPAKSGQRRWCPICSAADYQKRKARKKATLITSPDLELVDA